eukprot:Rhum_TRINITY_DN8403_c0_g1::Rhum_TRINITY_DN8403_c0_g1_i1::g.27712::m.27712/K19995/SCAMP; secretory carrier-associated membrane protein
MPADDETKADGTPAHTFSPPVAQTTPSVAAPVPPSDLPPQGVDNAPAMADAAPFASAGVMMGAAKDQAQHVAVDVRGKAESGAAQADTQARAAAQQAGQATHQAHAAVQQTTQREWDRLRAFEEQLQRKEHELAQRELSVQAYLPQQPNFPSRCPGIKPQVYHNIQADFIPARTAFMKSLYINYYILCFLVVYQSVVDLMVLLGSDKDSADDDEPDFAEHFGVSLLYLFGFCAAFMLWYWPTYKALAKRRPAQYKFSFIGLTIAALFNVVMLVGYVGHGGTGILFTAKVLDRKSGGFLPILALIGAGIWGLQLAYFIWALHRVRRYYNEDIVRNALPETLRQAQTEVLGAVVREVVVGGGGKKSQRSA